MNINVMKFIDFYLGSPICWLLNLFDRFFKSKHTDSKTAIKKILVIKFWGMGSIILSFPMLKHLKEHYPQAKIYFLTFDRNKEILELSNLVDNIILLKLDKKIIFHLTRLFWRIKREKFDLCFNLEFLANITLLLVYMSGIPIRIGFKHPGVWKKRLLTHEIVLREYQHIRQNFLNLLKSLGIPIDNSVMIKLVPSLKSLSKIDELLADKFGANSKPLICVNVNTGELALERRWHKENFVSLLNDLDAQFRLVLIGSASETDYVHEVIRSLYQPDNVLNLSGRLNIEELIALLSKCNLLITNDSGPLHLAAVVNTPTVSFFGPETPYLYGPLGENHKVFFKEILCSPCIHIRDMKTVKCDKEANCLREITPAEVIEYIHHIFKIS